MKPNTINAVILKVRMFTADLQFSTIRDAKENKDDDKKKSLIVHFNPHRWNIKTLQQFFDIIYLFFVSDVQIFSKRINIEQVDDS